LATRVAEAAQRAGVTLAVAESLTAGGLAQELAAAANASEWFAGGVVAYRPESKFGVLSVTEGPVMSRRCAEEMARGVRALFAADVAVATTGVGGPDEEEGEAPGSVYLAVASEHVVDSRSVQLAGDVEQIIDGSVEAGLEMLLAAIPV
jgi:nicotinamide-nucleotide amidase